jgi:hypothetical protein
VSVLATVFSKGVVSLVTTGIVEVAVPDIFVQAKNKKQKLQVSKKQKSFIPLQIIIYDADYVKRHVAAYAQVSTMLKTNGEYQYLFGNAVLLNRKQATTAD